MTNTQLPLDPNRELLKWGPTPQYPVVRYETCVTGLFVTFPKLYPGFGWPLALVITDAKRFIWMCDYKDLCKKGRELFEAYMLPREKRQEVRSAYNKAVEELTALQEKIGSGLGVLSDHELSALWTEFHHLTDMFWAHATPPELGNYGSSELLADKLKEYVPESDMAHVLEAFCAPEGISFYQQEEIDLAETNDIGTHQKKYFWLKNSYAHVEVLPVEFFEKRKKEISTSIRQESDKRLAEVVEKKDAIQKQYNLPKIVREMGDAIGDGIHWQDERKKVIWIYLHYEQLMLEEVARRIGTDAALLGFLRHEEMPAIISRSMSPSILEQRREGTGVVAVEGAVTLLDTASVLEYWKIYVDTMSASAVSEFKGVIASKGKGVVRGKVRIVLDPHGEVHFEDGEVLVTTMTTPEFIFVMKKSSAILTDTGGLTSHAAIVSRELGVPCLVGTKVATQVLKDGDMVEVDANAGIVRKI